MSSPAHSDLLKTFATDRSGEAFRVLVEAHAGVVTGVAHRITGSHEIAEEVTQDVFTLLARRAAALANGDAPLPAWLHRTATYMALNARKREKRRHSMLEKVMHELPQSVEPPPETPEWLPHLDAALNALTAPDRQLLLLHHAAGYTLTEAAAQLGLSAEAVKKRSQRAMDRLRSLMQRVRSGAEGPHGPQGPPMADSAIPVSACLVSAFAAAAISPAKASSIAANALSASQSAGTGAVLLNILHTMNYTKAAAAIAVCLALGNLGWQQYEITSTRRAVEELRQEKSKNATVPAPAVVARDPASKKVSPDKTTAPAMGYAQMAQLMASIENGHSLTAIARLSSAVEALTEEQAAELLNVSSSVSVGPSVRDGLRKVLLARLASFNPAKALELSMKFWESASGSQATAMIVAAGDQLAAWLKKDRTAALQWLAESDGAGVLASRDMEGVSPQRILRGAALVALAESAPDEARTLLNRLPPEERVTALNHAAGRMDSSANLKSMLDLMMTLPPGERTESVTQLASRAGMKSREAALGLVSQAGLSPADTAVALAGGISEAGRDEPLSKSFEWLAAHTTPETIGAAQLQFLLKGGVWYHTEESIPALTEFIRRGEVTDRQIADFAVAANRPEILAEPVLQMAAAISDPAIRREATSKIVADWSGHHAESAAEAVQRLTLPQDEKTALLKGVKH
jgi:RNA polymerase sigma factor (sigma-70 family)